jgi:hypothetical protein
MAAGVAVALSAGIAGWAVADQIAADPAGTPVSAQVLNAGPARLKVSSGWQAAKRPPALPGLESARTWAPYSGLATTVSVALVPADHAALVPSQLVAAAEGGLPRPEKARVVGLEARAYRGVVAAGNVLDIYAIPTTRGVLTLACAARSGAQEAPTWCLSGLEQITVEDAQPLKPEDATAYRLRAPQLLKALDEVRVSQRVALRRAKGPVGQERAARALYRSYLEAADALAPLAPEGEPPANVVAALREAARAYRALGDAAERRSKRAWARGRTAVSRAERALRESVAAA